MKAPTYAWRKYAADTFAHFSIEWKGPIRGAYDDIRYQIYFCGMRGRTARLAKGTFERCPDCIEAVQSLSKIANADNDDSQCEACGKLAPRYRGLFHCEKCYAKIHHAGAG